MSLPVPVFVCARVLVFVQNLVIPVLASFPIRVPVRVRFVVEATDADLASVTCAYVRRKDYNSASTSSRSSLLP